MNDFIKISVEIEANGGHSTFRNEYPLNLGHNLTVEAARSGADAAARAAVLHVIDPRNRA